MPHCQCSLLHAVHGSPPATPRGRQRVQRALRRALASALVATVVGCSEEGERPAPGGRIEVGGDAGAVAPDARWAGDLASALAMAGEGDEILLAPGEHPVDNPVVLAQPGLSVRGAGADRTRIRPRNAGATVFALRADGATLRDLAIDSRGPGGGLRSGIGVLVEQARGTALHGLRIVGSGGSAIDGRSVDGLRIEDCVLLDSGDDAVFFSGKGLRVLRTLMVRYVDEAIDVSPSDDVVIADSCMAHGRHGVSITANDAAVARNRAEHHFYTGIRVGSPDGRAVVTDNEAFHTGHNAFRLVAPAVVTGNAAHGSGRAAFQLDDMRSGVVQGNHVSGAPSAFRWQGSRGVAFQLNQYEGPAQTLTEGGDPEEAFFARENATSAPAGSEPPAWARPEGEDAPPAGDCLARLEAGEHEALRASVEGRVREPISVSVEDPEQQAAARQLADLLGWVNPGVLTLDVRGQTVTSRITPDWAATLSAPGPPPIGSVRTPVRRMQGLLRSPDVEWRLWLDDRHVATVRNIDVSPDAEIELH